MLYQLEHSENEVEVNDADRQIYTTVTVMLLVACTALT